jgi:hypothetical protein
MQQEEDKEAVVVVEVDFFNLWLSIGASMLQLFRSGF